jgi:hypothetical protein
MLTWQHISLAVVSLVRLVMLTWQHISLAVVSLVRLVMLTWQHISLAVVSLASLVMLTFTYHPGSRIALPLRFPPQWCVVFCEPRDADLHSAWQSNRSPAECSPPVVYRKRKTHITNKLK